MIPFRLVVSAAALLGSSSAWATQAQPVPIPEDPSIAPQIEVDGTGIATAGFGRRAGYGSPEAGVDFSDTALQLGAAQRLYDGGGVGSLGVAGMSVDGANTGKVSSLFLFRAFVDYQTESFEALVGRADNPTAHLVDFPTLRGDDLITLVNPLNPFSDGTNDEEHRYSNVASVTFNQGLRYYANLHAQHLIDRVDQDGRMGINSFGAVFECLGTVGMEAFARFPSWGLGYEHVTSGARAPHGLHQLFAGGVMNLNESVVARWDLRAQDILSFGSDLESLANATDSYRAASNTLAASLRYLDSPFGRPGYQLALTAAFKRYFEVASAQSLGWALSAVKRLGQGFDLVAQYQGQWRDTALAAVQSGGLAYEQVAEVGLVFNFNATFNGHIGPRRTILNQQHRYLPD